MESIQRARSDFNATRPLFGLLSNELEVFEQRRRALDVRAREESNPSDANPRGDVSLTQLRAATLTRLSAREKAVVGLPPPVLRPWSVDRLLAVGEVSGRRVPLASKRATPKRVLRAPFAHDAHTDGTKPDSSESEDEHDYKFNEAFYANQGLPKPSLALIDVDSDVSHERARDDDSVRGHMPREIPQSLMEAHIERANARKALRDARLLELGIRAPGSRIEMAVQAEDDDDSQRIGTKSARNSESQNDSNSHQRSSVGRNLINAGESLVLDPQLPFQRHIRPEPGVMSTNTETVWQRVLQEEKLLEANHSLQNGPSLSYQQQYGIPLGALERDFQLNVPTIPNAWLEIVQSSANAASALPRSSGVELNPARTIPHVSHSQISAKNSILCKIDQIQLASEEMLIRNRVVRDPLPSSVGGAFAIRNGEVAQDFEENLTRAAISHVAAAYSDPTAREEAQSKFRPVGGYGSLADGSHAELGGSNLEDQRWFDARVHNERKQHALASENEQLRSWATNLPTNFVGSLVDYGPAIRLSHGTNRNRSAGFDNTAKRKWGDVTFAAPNQQAAIPPGAVEALSSKARGLLFPGDTL